MPRRSAMGSGFTSSTTGTPLRMEPGARVEQEPRHDSEVCYPRIADGKLYVGTENGKFFIILRLADCAEILD